ncbi:hypothetical protein [Citrobacter sedlakii]|uniref:hypothetical protein n=1 Tax=Citrobacter sedlakii TaxID=67826 RepID=UPI0005AA00FA|nr:hypothetical protein [Citrobacter sedlakii]
MSTITKEEALAVADLKAGYTLGHADVVILQELARIAPAALTAEPVGLFAKRAGAWLELCQGDTFEHPDGMPLYAAPPAPEKMSFSTACNFVQINGLAREDRATLAMRAWNACRAAMLQAGNDSTNGKALTNGDTVANTPDCWIKSS